MLRASWSTGEGVTRPPQLSSIEDIIDDARNGRMFILIDDENRENEGDLVVPAQMATPATINFMARYGRGLICLALTRARVAALKLPAISVEGSQSLDDPGKVLKAN